MKGTLKRFYEYLATIGIIEYSNKKDCEKWVDQFIEDEHIQVPGVLIGCDFGDGYSITKHVLLNADKEVVLVVDSKKDSLLDNIKPDFKELKTFIESLYLSGQESRKERRKNKRKR
jgi:hypothetical protein